MNEHGIVKKNLVETLPIALRNDPSVVALTEALADVLAARPAEIERLLIYLAIDTLEEPLLDILAYDFKVDWWDADYSLEEKRRTLKDSWRVHKLLGTKAAVETAISAIYPDTKVSEWWEYGGRPYHFKISVNVSGETIESEKLRQVLARVRYYKNLRSHNDGVTYFMRAAEARAVSCAASLGSRMCVGVELPIPPEVLIPHVRAGTAVGIGVSGQYQKIKKEVLLDGSLG